MKYKILILIILMLFTISCASFRPNPKPWTRKEKTAAGFFVVAHIANAFSTKAISDSPYCYESNFIMEKDPSNREIAGYFSITGAIALGIAHFYPNTRVPLLMGYGGINAFLTVYDYSLVSDQNRKYSE